MLGYLKKYPFSLLVILTVIFLSFFRPPSDSLPTIPNFDKVAHLCMYTGLSGCLWLEFLRTHRKGFKLRRVFIGAIILPIAFSGVVELAQEYLTSYRGGDWMDFAANSIGVLLAALIGNFVLRPYIERRMPKL